MKTPPARSRDVMQLTLFLPVNDAKETGAAVVVLDKLLKDYEGLTRSTLHGDGRSEGLFLDTKSSEEPMRDFVTVVHVLVPNAKIERLPEDLEALHAFVHQEYENRQRKQKTVWIVHHAVRVLKDDTSGTESPIP